MTAGAVAIERGGWGGRQRETGLLYDSVSESAAEWTANVDRIRRSPVRLLERMQMLSEDKYKEQRELLVGELGGEFGKCVQADQLSERQVAFLQRTLESPNETLHRKAVAAIAVRAADHTQGLSDPDLIGTTIREVAETISWGVGRYWSRAALERPRVTSADNPLAGDRERLSVAEIRQAFREEYISMPLSKGRKAFLMVAAGMLGFVGVSAFDLLLRGHGADGVQDITSTADASDSIPKVAGVSGGAATIDTSGHSNPTIVRVNTALQRIGNAIANAPVIGRWVQSEAAERAVTGVVGFVDGKAAPAEAAGAVTNIHTVKRGDSVLGLALKYNVSVEALVRANSGLIDPNNLDHIEIGWELNIPGSSGVEAASTPDSSGGQLISSVVEVQNASAGGVHTVKRGQTLSEIAWDYGVSERVMIEANSWLTERMRPNGVVILHYGVGGDVLKVPNRTLGDTLVAAGEWVVQKATNLATAVSQWRPYSSAYAAADWGGDVGGSAYVRTAYGWQINMNWLGEGDKEAAKKVNLDAIARREGYNNWEILVEEKGAAAAEDENGIVTITFSPKAEASPTAVPTPPPGVEAVVRATPGGFGLYIGGELISYWDEDMNMWVPADSAQELEGGETSNPAAFLRTENAFESFMTAYGIIIPIGGKDGFSAEQAESIRTAVSETVSYSSEIADAVEEARVRFIKRGDFSNHTAETAFSGGQWGMAMTDYENIPQYVFDNYGDQNVATSTFLHELARLVMEAREEDGRYNHEAVQRLEQELIDSLPDKNREIVRAVTLLAQE